MFSVCSSYFYCWNPCRAQQAPLSPLGTPLPPDGTTEVDQMAFDFMNQTLYLANAGRNIIVQVSDVSTAPLSPSNATPWTYSIVAGRSGGSRLPGSSEVTATDGTFDNPSGVVGWPQYAVGPSPPTPDARGRAAAWVGLWIADQFHHALRFIHFHRNNNVTLVAGSPMAVSGARDGLGMASLHHNPKNIAWGRFVRSAIVGPTRGTTAAAVWTSVVYWSDHGNNCLRQGVPLHNDPAAYSPLEDVSSIDQAASVLRDMILNVSTFAGVCGVGNSGSGAGLVVPWSKMLYKPWGVALVGLPVAGTTSTVILFVGDYYNTRLSMIAPMYPLSARTLTVVCKNVYYAMVGVTVGRVHRTSSSLFTVVGVELLVATYGVQYLNVSVDLWVNTSNGSVGIPQGPNAVMMNGLTTSGLQYARNSALVRYYNSTNLSNRTLVVFCGTNGNTPTTYHVLEFYCCLDSSYSDPLVLEDTTATGMEDSTLTWSVRRSRSQLRSRSPSSGSSRTSRLDDSRSGSPSTWRGGTRIRKQRTSFFVQGPANTTTMVLAERKRSTFARRTASGPMTTMAGGGPPRNASGSGSPVWASLAGYTAAQWEMTSFSTAAAGVAVATVVPGASTKATVTSRTAAVWQCSIVGPAQAAADDSQQFLSFGLPLGSEDDGSGEGIVRGALVMTSCLRVGILVVMMMIASKKPVQSAIGVIAAVSIGYFTPNVVGLCTAVLLSSSSTTTTMICSVASLVMELGMTAVIAAAVWGRGGPILQAVALDFIEPIRRRRRWYYRVAGLEDLGAAVLIAVCSNIPLDGSGICIGVAWAIFAIAALHLLYVVALRPFREKLDTGMSILLAFVNAAFALLCCVVTRDENGAPIVNGALIGVAVCFYLSLAVSIAVTVWEFCSHFKAR